MIHESVAVIEIMEIICRYFLVIHDLPPNFENFLLQQKMTFLDTCTVTKIGGKVKNESLKFVFLREKMNH